MTACQIVTNLVPDGDGRNFYSDSPMRAVHQCETHGMHDFHLWTLPDQEPRCPVGKVEAAVEAALVKIAAASAARVEDATRAFLRVVKPSWADRPLADLNRVDIDDADLPIADAIKEALSVGDR